MATLNSLYAEYERMRAEQGRKEIEKEDAAWNALPQSEKNRLIEENAARYAAMFPSDEEE